MPDGEQLQLEFDPEDACSTCGGEREVFDDRFDPHRGHHTRHRPCPECAADFDDDLPTTPRARSQMAAYERALRRSLSPSG